MIYITVDKLSAVFKLLESAHKLVDEIAPKLIGRDSGHLRIEKTRFQTW